MRQHAMGKKAAPAVRSALRALASGAALTLSVALPAAAEDVIKLKVTHLFPNSVHLWAHGGQIMVDEIEKASSGQVKFTVFPSGQLGKDTLSTVATGLADIGIVIPTYSPEKLPLSSVAELPGLYENARESSQKMWEIANPDGVLGQAEYGTQGVRVLIANVQPA